MKKNVDFTEENFDLLYKNINDFEDDFWSIQHFGFLLDLLFSEYVKLPLSSENDDKRNHLAFGIDLCLNSILDLHRGLYYFYMAMLHCKPYNH